VRRLRGIGIVIGDPLGGCLLGHLIGGLEVVGETAGHRQVPTPPEGFFETYANEILLRFRDTHTPLLASAAA